MKSSCLIICSFVLCISLFSSAQTRFSRFFRLDAESIVLTCIAQTSDGGYVLAGSCVDTIDYTDRDVFLVKFSSLGDTLWTRRMGDTTGSDMAWAIEQTNDEGFIIAGMTNSYFPFGGYDPLIIKTDSLGNVQWSKVGAGGPDIAPGSTFSVKQNSDNGYIIAFTSRQIKDRMTVARTDSAGNLIWMKRFWDYFGEGHGCYAEQTSDGGFIVGGNIMSNTGNSFPALFKLSSSGNLIWHSIFQGSLFPVESNTYFVKQTLDGGYATVSKEILSSKFFFHEFDSFGNVLFGKEFETGILGGNINTISVKQLPDNSYLLLVSDYFVSTTQGISILIKLNSAGDTLWTKSLNDVALFDAIFTNDGSISGASNVEGVGGGMHKLDTAFYSECITSALFPFTVSDNTTLYTDSISIGLGIPLNNAAITNMPYRLRELYSPCIPDLGMNELNTANDITLFPNPTSNQFTIHDLRFTISNIEMYNVFGEKVYSQQSETNNPTQVTINISRFPPGIYFVKVKGDKTERTVKFIKQ